MFDQLKCMTMAQELPTPTRDEFGPLEPDEIEALAEELAEEREMERLTKDKRANYAMLRKLQFITKGSNSIAVMELTAPNGRGDFFKALERIAQFHEWKVVEGGEIRVKESADKEDSHGYVVVRPKDDEKHDLYLRVWDGWINSVIIMPRRDEPLPRQGREKAEIMEQMELVRPERLDDYVIWLMRMRKVE